MYTSQVQRPKELKRARWQRVPTSCMWGSISPRAEALIPQDANSQVCLFEYVRLIFAVFVCTLDFYLLTGNAPTITPEVMMRI